MGWHVSKFSQPRNTMQTPGIPDLYARHWRLKLRVWIEVKAPGNGPTLAQRQWHRDERECGGEVLIVRSVDELVEDLRALGAPIE